MDIYECIGCTAFGICLYVLCIYIIGMVMEKKHVNHMKGDGRISKMAEKESNYVCLLSVSRRARVCVAVFVCAVHFILHHHHQTASTHLHVYVYYYYFFAVCVHSEFDSTSNVNVLLSYIALDY